MHEETKHEISVHPALIGGIRNVFKRNCLTKVEIKLHNTLIFRKFTIKPGIRKFRLELSLFYL